MRESDIQSKIRVELSKYGMVFRMNSGDFWQGRRVYSREFRQEVLTDLRRVVGLPKGFSDLLFIGDGSVAFLEVKKETGRIGADQERFLEMMRNYHHKAGIVRSVGDAVGLIKGEYK